jgi:hypothetical protein
VLWLRVWSAAADATPEQRAACEGDDMRLRSETGEEVQRVIGSRSFGSSLAEREKRLAAVSAAKLEHQSVKFALTPCYCRISLRFSSNSALSISPLANRSFKISRAREAVSCTSGSSSRRDLRRP